MQLENFQLNYSIYSYNIWVPRYCHVSLLLNRFEAIADTHCKQLIYADRRAHTVYTHIHNIPTYILYIYTCTRPHYGYTKIHACTYIIYNNEWRRMNNRYCTFDKYLLFNYHFKYIYR